MKKTSIQKYDRFKILSLEEGFALIASGVEKTTIDGALVSIDSLRLKTFLCKGVHCAYDNCQYAGKYFAVERGLCDQGKDKIKKPFHLNLWGVCEEGKDILFTHDHVRARGYGGDDHIDNTQTMCCWHNRQKSKEEQRYIAHLKKMAGIVVGPSKRSQKKKAKKLLKKQKYMSSKTATA